MTDTFLADILAGLIRSPKTLPSMYFYNKAGSKLFQTIMQLPEYYLTKSEFEILDTQSADIYKDFNPSNRFEIVEFGAGDGSKTKLLLKEILTHTEEFVYSPIDISKSALKGLDKSYKVELPKLNMNPINADYFSALDGLKSKSTTKLVLFMGSNIGNFKDDGELDFLKSMRANISVGDHALIGFDLKKDPRVILDAYNDKSGVTREFNLNLLKRINAELGADFDIPSFEHYPTYNPITGEATSYLISLKDQNVRIDNKLFHFEYGEPIFTEISKKYSDSDISKLALSTGFEIVNNYYDCKHYFVDSLWRAV
ncbi:MAG: L-histidine N(alpha)-methyltransferase [Ignavibacteriae bacterium HGW-Ignavibacteriae-4]|jgi:dimethylhistidine N-methyltransferase|nr:MAG: L-histidine N(alpha)-methyltransferase [Ignavibacteriae bacterium HGW-Ignavibacteriae-4]